MCGIAGVYIKHPDYISTKSERSTLNRFVDELFQQIETRGRDATGFVSQAFNGAVVLDKKPVTASTFVKIRDKLPKNPQSILMHTRLHTKGAPSTWANNHPVMYEDVFTVHNGIITNDDELFAEHGLARRAEVDTEIIPALLAELGLENAKEVFPLIRGSMASASIAPVKHRGVVLLARSSSSPLVLIDTANFVVWASTVSAVQMAWKKVLGGTEPDFKRFTWLSDGDMVWLDGDEVKIERKAFSSYSTSALYGRQYSWSHQGWVLQADEYEEDDTERYKDYWRKHGSSSSPAITRQRSDHEKAIQDIRDRGKSLAFTWNQMKEEGMPEELKAIHTNRWKYCDWCKTCVMWVHAINTPLYGDICLDCSAFKNGSHPGMETDDLPDVMATIDASELEAWCDTESSIHNEALLMLSSIFRLSADACEWVMFRIEPGYVSKNPTYADLQAELLDAYDDCCAVAWQRYADQWAKDHPVKNERWIVHPNGETHAKDEVCEQCNPDQSPPPSCEQCGVEAFDEEEDEVSVAEIVAETTGNTERVKCQACDNRSATIFLGGRTFRWCRRCFRKCLVRGCKADTVGWGPDHKRRCHSHMRGIKGGYFDGDKDRIRKAAVRA